MNTQDAFSIEQKALRDLKAIEKRLEALQAACKLTLLFHSCSPWDREKAWKWLNYQKVIAGLEPMVEATTKVLCDAVRAALGDAQ